ncbi:MAG: 16S rRNA (guanine(527)-N(7))-methyltransferase RsmG [Candidatus Methylomirabilaceae bacterium]
MRAGSARASGQDPALTGRMLGEGFRRLGIEPTSAQREAFALYLSELLRWGARINLTGFSTEEEIVREGFLRSMSYRAAFDPAPGMKAVDIGSGAGFPGLVLKICYPEIDMLLVEASRRRASFLRSLIRHLGQPGMSCFHGRAEQLHGEAEHHATYQVAFARAVGALPEVVALAEPLLAPGGRLVVQVGRRRAQSLDEDCRSLIESGLKAGTCVGPAVGPAMSPTEFLVVKKALAGPAP